jgi:DNA-binding LytR/AlgR family response regulator
MIRTLIIEDESPAAIRLKRMLEEVEPSIRVVDTLESVSSAVRWLENNPQPDLLMLDIQLADGLSFEIFKQVTIDSFVIFTTAYDEYAIKAFELNSIDYLLKPIHKEKLNRAIGKFKKLKGESASLNVQALLEAMDRSKKKYKERFAINVGVRIKSIEVSRIAYFYSLDKSTFLCTKENRHYPVDYALDKLEELLDPDHFFRVNRQYMVNYHSIEKIDVLSKSRVAIQTIPATEETLLVSTARTHQFRLWLDR